MQTAVHFIFCSQRTLLLGFIMYNLRSKVAIVTGGANGIGSSIVREFVAEGAKYVAIIDVEDGGDIEKEIISTYGEGRANFFKCDVTKQEQLFDVFNKVIEDHGYIDVVVNNAGIADESMAKYKILIDLNFTAVVTSTLKALELMRVDHGGKGGTIINISSIVALSHDIGLVHIYAGTKSAVLQFSNRCGMDELYSRTKVRVVTVCFGATNTDILKTAGSFDEELDVSIKKFCRNCDTQTPEEAAKGVVYSYKAGNSGSTWLINRSEILDITDRIKKANEIMSANIVV